MYISLAIASRNDLISQLLLSCSRVKLVLISAGNLPKIIGDCPSDSKREHIFDSTQAPVLKVSVAE
jgi:hypothetical protein